MANYTYDQLEQLWTQAGGSPNVEQTMAAIAEAESSGDPNAVNYNTNGSVDRGLWQVNSSNDNSSAMFQPLPNAQEAVAIERSQGLGAWVTFNSGAYQKYMQGGGSVTAQTPEATATTTASTTLDPANALNEMGALFHGIAQGLNWAFWVFSPGQGWRFLFGVGGVASGIGAAKLYMSPNVSQEKSAAFPLAILLTGTSFLFLYMTLRAWPENGTGQAIRPTAYAWMIATGQKPPAGPSPADNTALIQGGLEAIASIWVVNKIAGGIGNLAGAAGILGGIWAGIKGAIGKLGGGGGGLPDIPPAALTVTSYPGVTA